MRIYQMTATFGKLEHQTLTLKPGLNVIHAPNEWGKSTWCAFLVAMLYGVDTRAKSTKSVLADKERYAPWSGQPMEGRIDLNWQGRDITIERKTGHRIPLGDFRAYETKSGLPIPELTAANCGQQLLGVEKSVFCRAGFIRQADLPVTQDEALRRRLNDLVTTGDESGTADRLADTLKDLKNKCRYNRSGLLPQAEAERYALEGKLSELETLETQCRKLKLQIDDLKGWIHQLNNHLQAMEYQQALATAERAALARDKLDAAQKDLQALESACAGLPDQETARQTAQELRKLQQMWNAVQLELHALPEEPVEPAMPEPFQGMTIEEARKTVHQDSQAYVAAKRSGPAILLIVMGILGLVSSGLLVFLRSYLFAGVAGVGSLAAFIWGVWEVRVMSLKTRSLKRKYGTSDHTRWPIPLAQYEKERRQYLSRYKSYQEASNKVDIRVNAVKNRRTALCNGKEPDMALEEFEKAAAAWDACQAARQEALRAQNHFDALSLLVKPVKKPEMADTLTQNEDDTRRLLSECAAEQQKLQNRLGQYQGRMDVLGTRESLQSQISQKTKRIAKLEHTYCALVIAQETLTKAREELQRRFAPRITRRAQRLMSAMTGGRYCQITMDTDFYLRTSTNQEDTLRDAIWRSDGTIDQLYLALRLAVAQELTPDIPLVLDDALVRFDDARLKAAVGLLKEIAQDKQVILFTCHGRELQA